MTHSRPCDDSGSVRVVVHVGSVSVVNFSGRKCSYYSEFWYSSGRECRNTSVPKFKDNCDILAAVSREIKTSH